MNRVYLEPLLKIVRYSRWTSLIKKLHLDPSIINILFGQPFRSKSCVTHPVIGWRKLVPIAPEFASINHFQNWILGISFGAWNFSECTEVKTARSRFVKLNRKWHYQGSQEVNPFSLQQTMPRKGGKEQFLNI